MSISIYTKFSNEDEVKKMLSFLEQDIVKEQLSRLVSADALHTISNFKILSNDQLPHKRGSEENVIGINSQVSDASFNLVIWMASKSSYREKKNDLTLPIYFIDKEKVYLLDEKQNKTLKLNVNQSVIDKNGLWLKANVTGVLKVIADIVEKQHKLFEKQMAIMKKIDELYISFNQISQPKTVSM